MVWTSGLTLFGALLVCGAGCAWAAVLLWRQAGCMRRVSLQLQADAAVLVELRHREEVHRQMEDAQWVTERLVDVGTDTVREVHMGISRATFGVLAAIPATRDTARVVRHTHDLISDSVYGSIRTVNRVTGRFTRGAIDLRTELQRGGNNDRLPIERGGTTLPPTESDDR